MLHILGISLVILLGIAIIVLIGAMLHRKKDYYKVWRVLITNEDGSNPREIVIVSMADEGTVRQIAHQVAVETENMAYSKLIILTEIAKN
jgi:hypothetical protein